MAKPEKRAAAGIKRPSSFSTRKPRVSFPRYVAPNARGYEASATFKGGQKTPFNRGRPPAEGGQKTVTYEQEFDHLGYNKELKELARKLREDSTPAEIRLWSEVLRGGKMNSYTFLRQRPVLNYIADFMCKELKLIIEVDSYSHNFERQWYQDKERQQELEEHGCTVLRFWDREVFEDIKNVAQVIELWIEEYEE